MSDTEFDIEAAENLVDYLKGKTVEDLYDIDPEIIEDTLRRAIARIRELEDDAQ